MARTVQSYRVLVGMEVHVQLATKSKMFSTAPNGATHFGAEPNSLVDEVVLGMPGVLPVMNKAAVESSIMVGLALGCEIAKHTKWDRKRAGTPLLESVTEPDLSTPEQVRLFAQELQRLVQFLGVSEGQMQMGHMRFEPNINVHITDADGNVHKTAITEIKNLNSFSVLERATAYEINRQVEEWEETGSLGRKSTY